MRAQYKPVVIFSVERGDVEYHQNKASCRVIEGQMTNKGIEFEKLVGSYNGIEETSYMVSYEHLEYTLSMAAWFSQHSILIRDNENNASLRLIDSTEIIKLGKMINVSVEEALGNDSWSFHPKLNKYFICKAV